MRNLSEKQIRGLGLKRKWLDDKSGSWWEMTLPGKLPVNILYDQDTDDIILRIKILNDYKPYKRQKCWDFFQKKPATLRNFKRMITYGTHISAEK